MCFENCFWFLEGNILNTRLTTRTNLNVDLRQQLQTSFLPIVLF